MNTDNTLQKFLLAAVLALPVAVALADDAAVMPAPGGYGAEADTPHPGVEGGRHGMARRPGPGMQAGMPAPGQHPGGMGAPGMMPPPFLHGLDLTETQQDKIFTILHGQAPYLRDQGKALHKAHEALRILAQSAQYDDAKAASLAQAAAQAMSNLELAHVRTEQKMLAVLTAEQRKQVEQRLAAMPQHGPHS